MEERESSYSDELIRFGRVLSGFEGLKAEAFIQWEKLKTSREKELKAALEREGLDICSMAFMHELNSLIAKDKKFGEVDLTNEELGVFPKSQMRYLYERTPGQDLGCFGGYSDTEDLQILCPEHFPEKPNVYESGDGEIAEVINKDGRFIIPNTVLPRDVTYILLKGMGHDSPYIENMYKNFGIAPLPERPQD